MVEALIRHVPANYGRYFEPFAGGAALFFSLRPTHALLADNNADLMNYYKVLRDDPAGLHSHLQELPVSEADYYEIRGRDPDSPVARAARFQYLATLAFNGIYRVNMQGRFNTPFGRRAYSFADQAGLLSMSRALQGVDLLACDFQQAVASARAGDFVYFDPPYTVSRENGSFVRYNERLYSYEDQRRLARVARELVDKGCAVLVSNANHASVLDLYPGFEVETVERPSLIAAGAKHRRTVKEAVIFANAARRPGAS